MHNDMHDIDKPKGEGEMAVVTIFFALSIMRAFVQANAFDLLTLGSSPPARPLLFYFSCPDLSQSFVIGKDGRILVTSQVM